jgi:hypothetical protein
VASEAICFVEGLVLVRLLQVSILGVVAIHTERRRRFGQMEIELGLPNLAGLMRDVASVAAHVEGGVAAAVFPRVFRANLVAGEAEIIVLIARGGFQQLILVVGGVRVVAFQTVANSWRVHMAFELGSVFIGVARKAKFVWSRANERYVSCILVGPDLMTTQTAHRDRGMDGLALRLILVAFEALGGVDVLI